MHRALRHQPIRDCFEHYYRACFGTINTGLLPILILPQMVHRRELMLALQIGNVDDSRHAVKDPSFRAAQGQEDSVESRASKRRQETVELRAPKRQRCAAALDMPQQKARPPRQPQQPARCAEAADTQDYFHNIYLSKYLFTRTISRVMASGR